MTPEAQKYLRELFAKYQRKFFELTESSQEGITAAILNERALTPSEIDLIRYYIENGSPTIVMEYRGDGIYSRAIFIDEALIDRFPNKEEEKFKEACMKAPMGFILNHKNGNTTFHGPALMGMTEKRLREKLKEEEEKENYEMCQEILKYAESQGWDLNYGR